MTALPRGRHQLSREEVAATQRARMLTAMADAMVDHGYVGTSVAEIIKRAGVSRETFYQQFSSKQDCFVAAFADVDARLATAMASSATGPGTPERRFDRLLGVYLGALATDPSRARLFLVEVYAAGPEVARRRIELQQRHLDGLCELFGVHTPAGRFTCEVLMAAVVSMVTTRVVAGDIDGLQALRAPLVELAGRILLD